jgi:hypothetical protein
MGTQGLSGKYRSPHLQGPLTSGWLRRVTRDLVARAAEDDALAIPVYDVIRDQRVVRVRVELDTPVGIVVDLVVHYPRPSGGADVDAVVVIRPWQPSAVVDAVALDNGVLRQGRRAAGDEAGALVTVGRFVSQDLGVVALDGQARQGVSFAFLGPPRAVELHVVDGHAVHAAGYYEVPRESDGLLARYATHNGRRSSARPGKGPPLVRF